jgi:hypothetical protein
MSIEVVAFIFGAVLLSAGFFGGGISVKDISIPPMGVFARMAAMGLGTFFIVVGLNSDKLHEATIPGGTTIAASPQPAAPMVQQPTPAPVQEQAPVQTPNLPAGAQVVSDYPAQPSSTAAVPEPVSPAPPQQDSSAEPDQEFKAQVGNQLVAMSQEAGFSGYTMTHDPYLSQLTDNSQESVTIDLSGGVSYGIVGVCDSDCRDLDLKLYDENGNEIAVDTSEDDIPVVTVTPQWDGPFTISVQMPSCAARYCYYGIGVFGQ